jgi:hypothetical protein
MNSGGVFIDEILKNNEFWLSCVGDFNDVRDSEQFDKSDRS